jgi:hypothetical protein
MSELVAIQNPDDNCSGFYEYDECYFEEETLECRMDFFHHPQTPVCFWSHHYSVPEAVIERGGYFVETFLLGNQKLAQRLLFHILFCDL